MNNPNVQSTPAWNILKRDGSGEKVESLIHCFLKRQLISLDPTVPILLRETDGLTYQCVYDNFILPENITNIPVIISFQKHTYGNFAVIRNYTPIVRNSKE